LFCSPIQLLLKEMSVKNGENGEENRAAFSYAIVPELTHSYADVVLQNQTSKIFTNFFISKS